MLPELTLISIGVILQGATFALGVFVGKALYERIRDR